MRVLSTVFFVLGHVLFCGLMELPLVSLGQIATQQKKPVDVYLIGGQSNATGQGYLKNLPEGFQLEKQVLIFHSGGHLNSGAESLKWHPLRQASESPDRFGPEIGFGRRIQARFPDRRIAIIKHAWSGTDLHSAWEPNRPGRQYLTFMDTVKAGLSGLKQQGYTPVIRGMLWQQGESDAKTIETARAYGENLAHLITKIRESIQTPEMLFAYGHVLPAADYSNKNSPVAVLRQQQRQVSETSCHIFSTRGALLVKTDGLSLRSDDRDTPHPNDVVHFGTMGTLELGQRFADSIADAIARAGDVVPQVIALGPDAHVTVYLPSREKSNGKAVVICPGGGYGGICTNTEGTPIAKHLVKRGIAGIVLKYNLPNGQHDVPGNDARSAIRLVRKHAKDWNLDPTKVGIWGFSAGGHLAATTGTLARGDERPNFQILFYPVISMQEEMAHKGSRNNLLGAQLDAELVNKYSLELQVTHETAPAFILHAASDRVVDPRNSLRYYEALIQNNVPAVLHIYQKGGHGPNAFKQNPSWEQALDDWLNEQ